MLIESEFKGGTLIPRDCPDGYPWCLAPHWDGSTRRCSRYGGREDGWTVCEREDEEEG